jgi:hypothetical protein
MAGEVQNKVICVRRQAHRHSSQPRRVGNLFRSSLGAWGSGILGR